MHVQAVHINSPTGAREEGIGAYLMAKMYFHADDFGITVEQARDILSLSTLCGGNGALNSLSIFVNSPSFPESSKLLLPFLCEEDLRICLHLNLVEGPCVSNPSLIPLLVDERGMFRHDFLGLLKLGVSSHRTEVLTQITLECRNQIKKFVHTFPILRQKLCLDSHQHTHAVPLVYKALGRALVAEGCKVRTLRAPLDPLKVYRNIETLPAPKRRNCGSDTGKVSIPPINRSKVFLIDMLWQRCDVNVIPWASAKPEESPLFCGVALSGEMHRFNASLLQAFEAEAARQHRSLEILFHPVSVPLEECLDPQNTPFAQACASPNRDKESLVLKEIPTASQADR